MDKAISIETLINEIRTIYQSNPLKAEKLIEAYLEETLKDHLPAGRIALLEKLVLQFEVPPLEVAPPLVQEDMKFESKEFSRLFSLLFGERVSTLDLSSTELMEKLAHSLNTIFDTMNEIIRVIDTTLLGKKQELETIRHIIGSQLEREAQTDSLQDYLTRIQKAFLVSHKAFQVAAHAKITEVLSELSPERFESERIGVLKFGPFRKAEYFEMYKDKFQTFKKWFDSGRFKEELLREFEKTCQKLYNADRR
jgi:hypothetical protein